jgi:DNA-binding MarR family transcriptional regulator
MIMTGRKTTKVAEIAPTNTSTLLHRLAKKITRNTSEEALGMRLRQYWVLSYLADRDGVAQHELADAFMLDANNAVLLLNELEDAGWIERRRNPEDRRRHLVFLTDDGRAAVSRALDACTVTENELLGKLDPAERKTLRILLVKALEE